MVCACVLGRDGEKGESMASAYMCIWYTERTVVTERKRLTTFGCFTHLSLHSQYLFFFFFFSSQIQ